MNFSSFDSNNASHSTSEITYYNAAYFKSQSYEELTIAENENFFIAFNTANQRAISLEQCPFGSYAIRASVYDPEKQIEEFRNKLHMQLSKKRIRDLIIKHPSEIYTTHLSSDYLKPFYQQVYTDVNQHIILSANYRDSIHKMQERKLQALISEGFEFRLIPQSDLKKAYDFLIVCRQAQGLEINITWDKLKSLATSLSDKYDCFAIFRENRISALCITVKVTKEVVYYFLPATSPFFRSQSPMVMLIEGMVDYYFKKGFKYLDLGISSIQGKPQETLKLFKERMGAVESEKITFALSL